ncbi:hypothetical protein SpCBS45565_g07215 [Spizellomyces sp. 'palustris']|nr:hypothetical protein SpCBS45565_g07215 [Spizellomyces sp. 'palustris']
MPGNHTVSFLNAPLGGSLLAPGWTFITNKFSDRSLFLYGTFSVQFFVFWIPSLLYLLVDVYRPSFLHRYKIQPEVHAPSKLLRRCAALVLFNQFFVAGPLLWLTYPFMLRRGVHISPTLPSPLEIVRDFTISLIVEEILFYYSHRLLHARPIYKYIHKLHHQFTAPVGMSAEYAHPIEHVLSNIVPVVVGPILMGSHLVTMWLWLSMALFTTVTVHAGYDSPLHRGIARFHDMHHEKFTSCFGVMGALDLLHGTDHAFRERYGGIGWVRVLLGAETGDGRLMKGKKEE